MTSSYYYGGIQIILGIVIAIPSLTIGTLSTTIALYVGLLLTGLYALLGSKYLKDAQHVLETYRDANYNPVLLPQHTERFLRLSCQFTYVYFTSSIILVALGLASFVQGTMAYFTNPVYTSNQGSTPAIAGIAALLVNLFISACLMGDIRRMRLTALDPSDRPRSPTPSGGLGGLGYPSAVDRPLDVSTVDLRVGEAFPPAYSQIDFSADKPVDLDDLPPPYLHALVLAMEDARNAAAVNGDAATTSLGSREIISSPVLLLPAEDMPSNSNTLANFDNSTNSNTEYSERVN